MLARGATSDLLATVQPRQDDLDHTTDGSEALQNAEDVDARTFRLVRPTRAVPTCMLLVRF